MCAIWWFYLDAKGYTVKEGIRGFIYIFAFNAVIIGFFTLMLYVTH